MNNFGRAYGIIGVGSKMSNWNADFSGYPKTLGDIIYGSDKALKYGFRHYWNTNPNFNVMYYKTYKISEKKGEVSLTPRSLKEKYEFEFGIEDLKKTKDKTDVIKNLFKCIDVKNFGATFAESGTNYSIPGAVQISQGINQYDETYSSTQQILSPFRDSSKDTKPKENKSKNSDDTNNNSDGDSDEAKQSTLGSMVVTDEAHYMYSFSVNPGAYKEWVDLNLTEGYTREDYCEFKKAALVAATNINTCAKIGCQNEFAVFVETVDDLYLCNLAEYVKFIKNKEDLDVIDIKALSNLISDCGKQITSVEIYYNPYTIKLDGDIKGSKKFNIFTSKEI